MRYYYKWLAFSLASLFSQRRRKDPRRKPSASRRTEVGDKVSRRKATEKGCPLPLALLIRFEGLGSAVSSFSGVGGPGHFEAGKSHLSAEAPFYRASVLTRDIDIVIMSVCLTCSGMVSKRLNSQHILSSSFQFFKRLCEIPTGSPSIRGRWMQVWYINFEILCRLDRIAVAAAVTKSVADVIPRCKIPPAWNLCLWQRPSTTVSHMIPPP